MKTANKYQLIKELRSGGMADLYLASSLEDSKNLVVIKKISKDQESDRTFSKLFEREQLLCSLVKHPNIIETKEIGLYQQDVYIVLEYIDGYNLRELITQRRVLNQPFHRGEIACIFAQTARGLNYLHTEALQKISGQAILHRDLTPHNIMIGKNGQVKLIDLGIAKIVGAGESTVGGSLKGKFSYMSPEQAEGQALTMASDVFSLGLVMAEALSFEQIFAEKSETEILRQLRYWSQSDIDKLFSNIPEEFSKLLQSMLEPNPQNRPTAQEILDQLSTIPMQAPPIQKDGAQNSQASKDQIITLYDLITQEKEAPARMGDYLPIPLLILGLGISFLAYHQYSDIKLKEQEALTQRSPASQKSQMVLLKFDNPELVHSKVKLQGKLLSPEQVRQGVIVPANVRLTLDYYDRSKRKWNRQQILAGSESSIRIK